MYILDFRSKVIHWNAEQGFYGRSLFNINRADVVSVHGIQDYLTNEEDIYFFPETRIRSFQKTIRHLGPVTITYEKDCSGYSLRNEQGQYLCSEAHTFRFSRDAVSSWETFIFIDDDFIERLDHLTSNQWISKRTGDMLDVEHIQYLDDFLIRIGGFMIDIRSQQVNDFGKYRTILFHENWKPEVFLLYSPVIYITAFSSDDVLNQLKLCISSIRRFGNYTGKIIVMTDRSLTYIQELCGEYNTDLLDTDTLHPSDFVGYVCSKYYILDKPIYRGHQPLLYLDPDIIFDNDLNVMLKDALLSEEICAPFEKQSPLRTQPSVGSSLIQLDGLSVGTYAVGLNGGTIIFPNTENPETYDFIKLVRRTIRNVGTKYGRNFCHWADQEVFNYMAVKLGLVNYTILTRYANFISNDPFDPYSKKGFVHFWGNSNKAEVMERYMKQLEEIERSRALHRVAD